MRYLGVKKMRKTYRIEIWREETEEWSLLLTWWGMPKGKTDGVLMAVDAFYNGKKIRAVCEQTDEVYQEVGGRTSPTGKTFDDMRSEACKILSKKSGYDHIYCDVDYYAYPQSCGSTNPFGGGGSSMTTFTVNAFVSQGGCGCVLFLCGRPQFREEFEPMMRYIV